MVKMDADLDPAEHGAHSAGISLGAPEPPRRMAELRAAAERRLRQSSREPLKDKERDCLFAEKKQSERQPIRDTGAVGQSRTPGSPHVTQGSAGRTLTPRGAAYKPRNLYSSRADGL
ncbi:unnamed protein product [Durusdinium trenchii]|uniref:Uncharacterized protein n=1 Tax=Durusdinium trenchii TaxID=1381693 RepID=A0ABP0SJ46_9DINO